ncbi:MAG: protein-disulfide reductase DsbD family protein, partial [Methylotenera sp.]|nr:protein-disulfide reductase DsbD family protein [Methylotenera sp.]
MKNTFLKNLACSLFAVVTFGFLTHVHAGEAKQSTIANALFDSSDNEYLSPDAAFKLELSAIDAQNIKANFTVAPGYYLYRERI